MAVETGLPRSNFRLSGIEKDIVRIQKSELVKIKWASLEIAVLPQQSEKTLSTETQNYL